MPLQATSGAASQDAFGGNGVAVIPNYIEDVFSTYLYTGTGSTLTITNGIDLSTIGGLVWIKRRNSTGNHELFDTNRGNNLALSSNLPAANDPGWSSYFNFQSTGFGLGPTGFATINDAAGTYTSWTFREQPKFFDVVTFTSSASGNKTFSHNLGAVPGCVLIKNTQTSDAWIVYHRSVGDNAYLQLNTTAASTSSTGAFSATSTTFTIASALMYNSQTYVAYLFAHDAGGFGLTGTDNVISCGSFTAPSSGTVSVTLGYEPQWILFKTATSVDSWFIFDTMRGWTTGGNAPALSPNTSNAESPKSGWLSINSTGFTMPTGIFASSDNIIYIAIRRGPMKVPTTGTSVFTPVSNTSPTTGNLTDLTINRQPTGTQSTWAISRLTNAGLETQSTNAQTSTSSFIKFDVMTGVTNNSWLTNSDSIWWNFKRAPSVFDVVVSAGTGSSNQARTHNLGVTPELIIVKDRSSGAANWVVYSATLGQNYYLNLNNTNNQQASTGAWGTSSFTATTFYCNDTGTWCASIGNSGVFYLFATCAGVSKVGSYTGADALQTVNCGFTGGARFVLIKRTDQAGDWWTYDSARGISSGNDPYLFLNSTAAQVTSTNYVDTDTTGFKVTAAAPAGLNATGGTYIFLAIA